MGKVVEITEEEWGVLVAPAVAGKLPIDSSTVDSTLFDQLYQRPSIDLKMSEVQGIKCVVPLV